MTKRILAPLVGFVAAALALVVVLSLCARWLRPDVSKAPEPPPPAELAAVEKARRGAAWIDRKNPPVIAQAVDYSEGSSAAWWPKGEAPVLSELVSEGRLPPVAERVGSEPVVLAGVEGVGKYGGTWHRLANSSNDVSTIAWRLAAPNLVRWSPQGYPIVPHLAKAWEISPDNRVFTFSLRRGMRWSDGHPLTSEDIFYWYAHEVKYFQAQPKFLRAGRGVGVVEKVDDLRVRFTFSEPNPLFIERLASVGMNWEDFSEHIVPAHYLRAYHPELGDQALIARTMAELKLSSPVAVYKRMKHYFNPEIPRLWPWIYHTYAPTTPQIFVRNPYYFAVDPQGNQLPYLDRLVMDIKTNGLIALSAANGEPSMQERNISYEDHTLFLSNAAQNGYSVYHWKPSSRSLFTVFPNLNRVVDPARPETQLKHDLLNDRKFRQALSIAINRRDIISAEFHGQAEPSQIEPGADSPFHSEKLARAFIQYDPATANRLLDELGLKQRDREGLRTFPNGERMNFYLNLSDYTIIGPAQFVVDGWARVGVRVTIRQRARRLFDQEKLAFEHDFTVWTGESEFYPMAEPRNFLPTYSESFFAPRFGLWYQYGGLYGDPAAARPAALAPPEDHPLRRAMQIFDDAAALPTEAARRKRFSDVLDLAAENLWTISIATPPPQLVIVKDGFRNVPHAALFGSGFQSPANAGLETYFWDKPTESPVIFAQTKQAIVSISPPPGLSGSRGAGESPSIGPSILGVIVRGLLTTAALVATLSLAIRHPFIGRRLLIMIPTMFVVSVMVFTLVQLPPGDFVQSRIARLQMDGTPANDQLAADLRHNFHLDEGMVSRYAHWVGLKWFTTFKAVDAGLLQGYLGQSMEHEKSVNEVIGDRIGLTLLVSLVAVLFVWLVAVPAGIYAAVHQNSTGDVLLTTVGLLGLSAPAFLVALVLMFLVKRWFGMNVDGLFSPEFSSTANWSGSKIGDLLRHLWLPVLVLGWSGVAGMMRIMRANLLDELRKPYVTTARAKGVRPLKLLLKYPVRIALNPFASGLSGLFPQLVSGGAIVAMVLSLPMIGPTMVDALLVEDVYLAGSMLMVLSLLGVVGTLASDLLLLWLDPRIRGDATRG